MTIILLGMAVFIPFDGKRTRLRNTPFPEDSSEEGGRNKMDVELPLFSDRHIRIVLPGAAFSGGGTSSYNANVSYENQENRETGKKKIYHGGDIC